MTEPITAELFDGLTVKLDPRTLNYGGAWYPDGRVYEPDVLRHVYQWAKDKPYAVIFDVGASTGALSLLAAHLPNVSVYAFEPVPDVYEILAINIILNQLGHRVFPKQEAIGHQNADGKLCIVQPTSQHALSVVNGTPAIHKNYTTEDIHTYTLDLLDEVYEIGCIDLIKIDVEGGEWHVLRGASAIIKRDHPKLILEYCAENTNQFGYNPDSIDAFLREHGYRWRVDGANLYTEA